MKQQNHHIITHHDRVKGGGGGGGAMVGEKGGGTEMADLKSGYGYKRSILRKLMIAQRQKFMMKKDKAELVKNNLAETSVSNISFGGDDDGGGGATIQDGKTDNMKYNIIVYLSILFESTCV